MKKFNIILFAFLGLFLMVSQAYGASAYDVQGTSPYDIEFVIINDTDKRMSHSLSWIDHDYHNYSMAVNMAGAMLYPGERQIFTRTFKIAWRGRLFVVLWKPVRAEHDPKTVEDYSSEMKISAPLGTIKVTIYHKRYELD